MSIDGSEMRAAMATTLSAHWRLFLIEGIVLLILGLAAVLIPPVATLAVAILIGWILLASGVVGLISTFRMRGAPGFGWSPLLPRCHRRGCSIACAALVGRSVVDPRLDRVPDLRGRRIHHDGPESPSRILSSVDALLVSGIVDLILAGIIIVGLPARPRGPSDFWASTWCSADRLDRHGAACPAACGEGLAGAPAADSDIASVKRPDIVASAAGAPVGE